MSKKAAILRKLCYITTVTVIILTLPSISNASPKNTVNILTRHNYLRSPKIAQIVKNRCGVDISYDEYFTVGEGASVISQSGGLNYYDIAILPDVMYEAFNSPVKLQKSNLSKAASKYSEPIRKQYYSRHYPDNIVYFTVYIQGFIWNPNTINISQEESIKSMFKKAKDNIVIIENSRAAVFNLVEYNYNLSPNLLTDFVKDTIQNTDIFMTSGYNKLYEKNRFAFAFQNSGDAISIINKTKNKKLQFFIHPKYSYINADILLAVNSRKETLCTAKTLASQDVLKIVQQETFYLSPYENYKSMNDQICHNTYKNLFNKTHNIKWLNHFYNENIKIHNKLNIVWHQIHSLPQIMKNHSQILKKNS